MKVLCLSSSHSIDVKRALIGCDIHSGNIVILASLNELRTAIADPKVRMLLIEVDGSNEQTACIGDIALQFLNCRILAFAKEDRGDKIGTLVRTTGVREYQCVRWHGSWPAFLSYWLRSWCRTIQFEQNAKESAG